MLKLVFNYIHLYFASISEIENQMEQLELFYGVIPEGFTAGDDATLFTFSNHDTTIYLYIHYKDE